jgi:hypothetical protein
MILLQHTIARVVLVTLAILLVPLAGTLLNPNASMYGGAGGGFDWTLSDFVVMGAILFVTGLGLDFAYRKAGKYRVIAIAAIIFAFLWLWAELAVGVFTNWGS